jgi:hypothetical protein
MPFAAFLVAVTAVVTCVGIHLGTLVILSRTLDRWFKRAHWWAIGCMVLIAIHAHIFEISVFAVGIRALQYLRNGEVWEADQRFFEPWYQSAVAYTTLGDETPEHASVRLLISVEALTGLILITWTASFLFLVMQRTWEAEHINWRNPPKKRSKPAPLQNLEIVEAGNLVG